MATLNFNAQQVAPDEGRMAIPAAWYNVLVDESEIKPTKDSGGSYLQCRYKVLDGAYKGQVVYSRFNIVNQNAQAQEIGYKQLSALAHAVNVLMVQDSSQLHNIPLKVKVKLRAAQGDYEESNEITAWKNINEVVPGSATAAVAATSAPAFPPATGFPPAANTFPPAGVAAGGVGFPPAQSFAPPVQQAPVQQAAPVDKQSLMTATAQTTYAAYIQAGWSDDLLVSHGFMVPAVQAAPAAPAAPAQAAFAGAPQPWQNGAPVQGHQAVANAAAPAYTADPAVALPPGANPQGVTPPWHTPQA